MMQALFIWVACICVTTASATGIEAAHKTLINVQSADGTLLKVWVMHPDMNPDKARPVVVALHGCGGLYANSGSRQGLLSARHQGMAELLVKQGYSVVFPDSFTSRGEQSLCAQKNAQRRIHQSHRSQDVHGVLAWLEFQPWVDVRKTALLGWSHGGSAVLASTNAKNQAVKARSLQPDVAIAFYPGCSESLKNAYQPTSQLFMLLAEFDDWTPPGPCRDLGAKVNAKVNVYAESHHGFDNPVGQVRLRKDVPNGVEPGIGVHVGRNADTGPQAWQDVVAYLAQRWQVLSLSGLL